MGGAAFIVILFSQKRVLKLEPQIQSFEKICKAPCKTNVTEHDFSKVPVKLKLLEQLKSSFTEKISMGVT